jgi:phage terminase large subunit GpA-like protein
MRWRGLFLIGALVASTAAGAGETVVGTRAEKNYREALSALKAARTHLLRVEQKEAEASRGALKRSGEWIEPAGLWREKRAAVEKYESARKAKREAFRELDRARDAVRRSQVGAVPRPEPLNSPFWWLW